MPESGIPARYSIPFFVGPAPTHTVAPRSRVGVVGAPTKYEPVQFEDYGALVSKYQYPGAEGDGADN